MIVETIQREMGLKIEPLFINSIINQFRKINQSEKVQKIIAIPWEIFRERFFTISFKGEKYGFNIASSKSEVSDFLRAMIQSKQIGGEAWRKFLKETEELDDEFFSQPVGKFEESVITLSLTQVNKVLNGLLERGARFEFNNH